jgi:UDP-N-acetylmuramoylalanine-D-glutamate ligase
MLRYAPAIVVGRLVRFAARVRKPGGGSAVPGLVVNTIAPGYLAKALASFPGGLLVVSGSNGKSTTTKMLVAILRAHGASVFTNPSTANIAQGLTSALLEEADIRGRVHRDLAVLEMDEAHGALLAPKLAARVVVLTNVQVDQIVRFHDPAMVRDMLGRIADRASDGVVINVDDANLVAIGEQVTASVIRYGVSDEVARAADHGFGYARASDVRLDAADGIVVQSVDDREAVLLVDGEPHALTLPSRGVHYAIDAAAAIGGVRTLLGDRFDLDAALAAVAALPPVFARGEKVLVRGQRIEFVLVKNPASFQLNIDALDPTGLKLVAYGSDLRDPSFFWTAGAARLGHVDIVSGSKAAELALQLTYDGVTIDRVEPDLLAALEAFLALPSPAESHKTIVFSADAMRRTRAYLGLTSEDDEA